MNKESLFQIREKYNRERESIMKTQKKIHVVGLYAIFLLGALAIFLLIEKAQALDANDFIDVPGYVKNHVISGCTRTNTLVERCGDVYCIDVTYWNPQWDSAHYFPTLLPSGKTVCQCKDWPVADEFEEKEDSEL